MQCALGEFAHVKRSPIYDSYCPLAGTESAAQQKSKTAESEKSKKKKKHLKESSLHISAYMSASMRKKVYKRTSM